MNRRLYLEERIRLVRDALNERTIAFQNQLPNTERVQFHQLILDCIAILDGLPDTGALERLK